MLRLLVILLAICALWRWAFGQWPWQALSTRPSHQQTVSRARKLLGVEARASGAEIKAAHKRLIAVVHPDRGGSGDKVHEANAARDLLLAELPSKGEAIADDLDEPGNDDLNDDVKGDGPSRD